MNRYRETQVSWPAFIPLVLVTVVLAVVFVRSGFPAGLLVLALPAGILLLFATLTVTVDEQAIEARFGVGLIRTRVPFETIRSCRVVQNPWYYGWGIRFIPGGMLYNASGWSAIELSLTNGRVVRIGSAAPEALAAVLPLAAPDGASSPGLDSAMRPIVTAALIIAGVLAVVVFTIRVGLQPPAVRVTADSFSVSNGAYSNTIPLQRIRAATLEGQIPSVRGKTNGFAAGETMRGSFRVDTWGNARLYVNLNHPPYVVVRSDDGFLAVNFANPEQTRAIYAELVQAIDRSRR